MSQPAEDNVRETIARSRSSDEGEARRARRKLEAQAEDSVAARVAEFIEGPLAGLDLPRMFAKASGGAVRALARDGSLTVERFWSVVEQGCMRIREKWPAVRLELERIYTSIPGEMTRLGGSGLHPLSESEIASNRDAIVKRCARVWRGSLEEIRRLAVKELEQTVKVAGLLAARAFDELFTDQLLLRMIRSSVAARCRYWSKEDREDLIQSVAANLYKRMEAGGIIASKAAMVGGYIFEAVSNEAKRLADKANKRKSYEQLKPDLGGGESVSPEPPLTFEQMMRIFYGVPLEPQQRIVWLQVRLIDKTAWQLTLDHADSVLGTIYEEFVRQYTKISTIQGAEMDVLGTPFVRDLDKPLGDLMDHPASRKKYRRLLSSTTGEIVFSEFAEGDLDHLRSLIPRWTFRVNSKIRKALADALGGNRP